MTAATRTRGLVAMAATVMLWAVFALSIRGIGHSSLTTADAAFVRFLTPVVVLSPWIPRALNALRHERARTVAALCFGAGLPYFAISALGGRMTSAALVGMVIPGTVPVFVLALSAIIWRTRASMGQMMALAAIALGVGVSVVAAASPAMVRGIGVLLAAGLVWSIYTLALRHTGLDPISAALVLCVPSALLSGVGIATGLFASHLVHGAVAGRDLLTFVLAQGLGVGVGAALTYAVAIRSLGPRTAATFGAASPVVTALAAIPLFGEMPSAASLASLALIVGGVVVFNRAPAAGAGGWAPGRLARVRRARRRTDESLLVDVAMGESTPLTAR